MEQLPNLAGGVLLLYGYEGGLLACVHAARRSLKCSRASITILLLRFDLNRHWVGVGKLQPARLPNLADGVLLLYRYEDGLHAVRQSLECSEASITIQMHGCVTPTEEPPRSTVQPESYGQAGSSLGWRPIDMSTVAEGDPGYTPVA